MSLVFAALRKLDGDEAPAATVPVASPVTPGWRRLALPALALGGVLITGWWAYPWRDAASPASTVPMVSQALAPVAGAVAPTAAPAPMQATAATGAIGRSTDTVPAPADAANGTSSAAGHPHAPAAPAFAAAVATASVTANRASTNPDLSGARAGAPATPAPATAPAAGGTDAAAAPGARTAAVSAPPAPQALVAEVTIADAEAAVEHTAEETDAREIGRAVASISQAIEAGELDAARAQLDTLAGQLPSRSLTLLRMQAWLAHESGDLPGALALYRRIVDRVPGDATAAINLAILESRNGETDSARRRLARLRAREGASREIVQAIDRVEAQLR